MRRLVCLVLVSGLLVSACTREKEQPKVLFIFADQLRSHELSCYGGTQIQTPNIDRPNLTSFAEAFNAAGYQSAFIGKWHLDGRGRTTYIPPERREGFQFFQTLECTHNYFNSQYYDNNSDEPKFWEEYDADSQTKSAQNYIQTRNKEQPFFLMLAWGPPHSPYIAPEEYIDQVNPSEIELRPNVQERKIADQLRENPRFAIPENFYKAHEKGNMELEDKVVIRRWTAGYLAATLALDDYMGALFAPIDMMPTVLGLADAECPEVDGEDRSQVILGPETDKRDAVLIMAMTHFHFAAIVNGVDNWRGVRTRQHTYARYEDGSAWLLYDNKEDPFQMNNLAEDPDYVDLINELNPIFN